MQEFLKRRREIRVVKLIVYLFEEVLLRFGQLSVWRVDVASSCTFVDATTLSATQGSVARTLSHGRGRSIEKF